MLGFAALALYPLQMYVIPKLQKKINQIGKQRLWAVRRLSDRIGETVSGAQEIHIPDISSFARTLTAKWLATIYEVWFEIFCQKFFVKFLNNFIAQVTPFLFYSIGGYLAIKGDLSFAVLVAVLAAYKDLWPSWKELLVDYQVAAVSRIKYDQLIEQFQPAGMLAKEHQLKGPDAIPNLIGSFESSNLIIEDEDGFSVMRIWKKA